jgi:DNA-binding IclR family transcriptional regulator
MSGHLEAAVRYALYRHPDGLSLPELTTLTGELRTDLRDVLERLKAAGIVERTYGRRQTWHLIAREGSS